MFAYLAGSPVTVQIEGPFPDRAACVAHEYFSTQYCLAGCVPANKLADVVTELNYSKPGINTAQTYCSNKQIGE